jgi:hypothetical protein
MRMRMAVSYYSTSAIKESFLLMFAKDRRKRLHGWFEEKKRGGHCALDCIVISNHSHLLIADSDENVIPSTLEFATGRAMPR